MRNHELEAWVLDVIDRVLAKRPHEDSRIELKAEWPSEHAKAARQIAAHANTSRGAPVLWIIGLDQERGLVGADHKDLANWWPMIGSQFSELAPDLHDLNVPCQGTTVVALLFDTDRAPFVVKNPVHGQPNGGPVSLEVPWREGTSTRTARRADLIRLLVPIQLAPKIELLDGRLSARMVNRPAGGGIALQVQLDVYIVPPTNQRLVIPYHRCAGSIWIDGSSDPVPLVSVRCNPPLTLLTAHPASATMRCTHDEILIDGPGKMSVDCESDLVGSRCDGQEVRVAASLHAANDEFAVVGASFSPVLGASRGWQLSGGRKIKQDAPPPSRMADFLGV